MVSIIICTYNRSAILELCLQRLADYGLPFSEKLEIVVVDNNSTDETKIIVEQFYKNYPELAFNYIFEKEQGLSVARNAGANKAKYEWLFYLDDDALVQEDTLIQCFSTIQEYCFDFFGGMYYAYYIKDKPKWIPLDLLDKKNSLLKISKIEENEISGCIMVVKKEALIIANGFKPHLGMTGITVAYGEETLLFEELKKLGFIIGFNPLFKIHHIVADHKQKLSWHLISHFKKGKSHELIFHDMSLKSICQELIKSIKFFIYAIINFVANKDYYYQNLILDSTKKLFELAGRFSVIIQHRI